METGYPTTVEGLVEFYEKNKHTGKYDLLWSVEGVKLITTAPDWQTLAFVEDPRAVIIAFDLLKQRYGWRVTP